MTVKQFNIYVESMGKIEAHEMLMDMKIQEYPNMKMDAKNRLHRKLYNQAYPFSESNKPLSAEQVFSMMKGI